MGAEDQGEDAEDGEAEGDVRDLDGARAVVEADAPGLVALGGGGDLFFGYPQEGLAVLVALPGLDGEEEPVDGHETADDVGGVAEVPLVPGEPDEGREAEEEGCVEGEDGPGGDAPGWWLGAVEGGVAGPEGEVAPGGLWTQLAVLHACLGELRCGCGSACPLYNGAGRLVAAVLASGGLEDHVGVLGGVAGADEADGGGDAEFEGVVGFPGDGCGVGEEDDVGVGLGGVVVAELFGHPDVADDEVLLDGAEEVGDGGDVVDEGDVDGFDLGPEGEAAVGEDDGVGVADAGEEGVDVGIEDSGFEHVFVR
jgi:hypothetical protein